LVDTTSPIPLPVTTPYYIVFNYPNLLIGSTMASTINVPLLTLNYQTKALINLNGALPVYAPLTI
jgi:hypothetical protein